MGYSKRSNPSQAHTTHSCSATTTLLLLFIFVLGLNGWAAAGEPTAKRALDLPVDGFGSYLDDEEAKDVIQFFGGTYEGDGFFFLLDVSGSMAGERIAALQAELTSALMGLSSRSEFGVVTFCGLVAQFDHAPITATDSAKSKAVLWAESHEANGPTFMLKGARTLLNIAHRSRKEHKVVIVVGDGRPSYPEPDLTLEGILAANQQDLPWNTILIGDDPEAVTFMNTLSESTGGTFRHCEI